MLCSASVPLGSGGGDELCSPECTFVLWYLAVPLQSSGGAEVLHELSIILFSKARVVHGTKIKIRHTDTRHQHAQYTVNTVNTNRYTSRCRYNNYHSSIFSSRYCMSKVHSNIAITYCSDRNRWPSMLDDLRCTCRLV